MRHCSPLKASATTEWELCNVMLGQCYKWLTPNSSLGSPLSSVLVFSVFLFFFSFLMETYWHLVRKWAKMPSAVPPDKFLLYLQIHVCLSRAVSCWLYILLFVSVGYKATPGKPPCVTPKHVWVREVLEARSFTWAHLQSRVLGRAWGALWLLWGAGLLSLSHEWV